MSRNIQNYGKCFSHNRMFIMRFQKATISCLLFISSPVIMYWTWKFNSENSRSRLTLEYSCSWSIRNNLPTIRLSIFFTLLLSVGYRRYKNKTKLAGSLTSTSNSVEWGKGECWGNTCVLSSMGSDNSNEKVLRELFGVMYRIDKVIRNEVTCYLIFMLFFIFGNKN